MSRSLLSASLHGWSRYPGLFRFHGFDCLLDFWLSWRPSVNILDVCYCGEAGKFFWFRPIQNFTEVDHPCGCLLTLSCYAVNRFVFSPEQTVPNRPCLAVCSASSTSPSIKELLSPLACLCSYTPLALSAAAVVTYCSASWLSIVFYPRFSAMFLITISCGF